MRFEGAGVSVATVVAITCVVLAGATIWLFLTNPVTVANAVNEGNVTPFIRELANVLYGALKGLLKYL
jgi:hypothetical protein